MTEQGYMQLSNAVIDDLMCRVSGNAFKVFMVIYRKTKGYNKASDSIPMSQLHELTGIKDKHTLIAAIDDLELNGFIKVDRKLGRTNLFQITNQCGKSTPVSEVHTSGENPHGVVGKIHTGTSGENPHPSKDNTKDNIQKTKISARNTPKHSTEPKEPKTKIYTVQELVDLGCDEQSVKDFFAIRKDKGSKTFTQSALNRNVSQAQQAGLTLAQAIQWCAEREWTGFTASWYANANKANQPATPSKPVVQQTPRFGDLLKDKTIRDVTPPKKSSEVRYVC